MCSTSGERAQTLTAAAARSGPASGQRAESVQLPEPERLPEPELPVLFLRPDLMQMWVAQELELFWRKELVSGPAERGFEWGEERRGGAGGSVEPGTGMLRRAVGDGQRLGTQ